MKNEKTEQCVICGIDTGVLTDVDIRNRKNYIEGAGQLCEECYNKFTKNENNKKENN